jgi:transcriptional regulator with XRE-family HTH domain
VRYGDAVTFGQVLSSLLQRLGLSQYRLCQLTGLGADTVCRLINDVRGPTEAQALRICLGLGLRGGEANRLLEAGDFYPLPDHTLRRPTGKTGWGVRNAGQHLGDTSITRAGNGR